MNEIYLDNSATTRPFPEVVSEMVQYLTDKYANPSSLYDMGSDVEKEIKDVRRRVAKSIHALPKEVYFTSGGSEGNNTLIKGVAESQRTSDFRLITTTIEHPSVLEVFKYYESCGLEVVYLPVDQTGKVSLEVLENAMTEKTALVSIMGVNNELGSYQELEAIGTLIKAKNPKCVFHTDFVQGYMKMPVDVVKSKIDAMTFCAHKICGPKGIGAIYLKDGLHIKPLIIGGGQELNLRSGTENVSGIMGFGKAVEIQMKDPMERKERITHLRKTMIEALQKDIDSMQVNGPEDACPYVLSLSFNGVRGEVLLHALEARGIYISTGSACATHKKEKQHVLRAIGLSEEYKEGTIRVSFSAMTTEEEVLTAAEAIKEEVAKLRLLLRFKR